MGEQADYTLESVTSQDGATITYRQLGSGPGVILLHGGLQAAQSFMSLASALSDAFTVYVVNRRGRGGSSPFPSGYGLRTDRADIEALVNKTGASRIFGLSSGAIIALDAARVLRDLQKVAVYEPPIWISQATPVEWVDRFDREVADGDLAAALATAMKGLQVSPALNWVPDFILVPLFRYMIARDRTHHPRGDVPMATIIPTMHFDMELVKETIGVIPSMRAIGADVLLMSGSRSPAFLKRVLDELAAVLPRAGRIEFPGFNHTAPGNGERPERVAAELRRFFA